MKLLITFLPILFITTVAAQQYVQVPLTKDDQRKKVVMHFVAEQEYAGAELYLFENGRFTFGGALVFQILIAPEHGN